MYYNVAQLMKEAVGATRDYAVDDEVSCAEEGWSSLPVKGAVHMLRTHRGVLVTAALITSIPEDCSWCLEAFTEDLDLTVEEEYFPVIEVSTGAAMPVPEEAGPFCIDERHTLNLLEAVRQAVLLARPLQPVCQEACRGLCSECGGNLLRGECRCAEDAADPRWAPLAKMLRRTN